MLKKILTIAAFLVGALGMQAQNVLLYEGFNNGEIPKYWVNVDHDGDGEMWQPSTSVTFDFSAGVVMSASFINEVGPLTPDNYLISPVFDIPADKTVTLSFWAKGQDPDYADENFAVLVSKTASTLPEDFKDVLLENEKATGSWKQYTLDMCAFAGQAVRVAFRHYDCTDIFQLVLDDICVCCGPTIIAPQQLQFQPVELGGIPPFLATYVTGLHNTGEITATVGAGSFILSINKTDWANSVTLPQEGGKLYVKFNPTADGVEEQIINLTTEGADNFEIAVSAEAYVCRTVSEFPFHEGFNDMRIPFCWDTIIAGGGKGWRPLNRADKTPDGSKGLFLSASVNADYEPENPNNYLITSNIHLTGTDGFMLSFWEKSSSSDEEYAPEHWYVLLSTTGTEIADFTDTLLAGVATVAWQKHTINISDYKDQKVYIAFVHHEDEALENLFLDEVMIEAFPGATVIPNVAQLPFGDVQKNFDKVLSFNVMTLGLTEAISIALPSGTPFSLSTDKTAWTDKVTITKDGGQVWAKFAPTVAFTDHDTLNQAKITLKSVGAPDTTVLLMGVAYDMAPVSTFPFTEKFLTPDFPRGWHPIDADGDGKTWVIDQFMDWSAWAPDGFCMQSENTTTHDNYMVLPAIQVGDFPLELSFKAGGTGFSWDPNKDVYDVCISTGGDNFDIDNMTTVFHDTTDKEGAMKLHELLLEDYSNKLIHIAFRHNGASDGALLRIDNVQLTEKVTVKFEAGEGGSGTMDAETINRHSTYVLPSCTFTAPSSQTFLSWNSGNPATSGQAGDEIVVDDNITLTAVWSQTVTITFAAGEGGAGTMDPVTLGKGATYTLPACTFTVPEGKKFLKWDLGEPGTQITVNEDVTITAQWADIVTITFLAGEHKPDAKSIMKVAAGSTLKLPKCNFVAPENKEFDRWNAGTTGQPGEEIMVDTDSTFTAQWKNIYYKVDIIGGTANPTEAYVGQEVEITANDSSAVFKAFDHWVLMEGRPIAFDKQASPVKFTMEKGGVKIEAIFKIETATISFDANGGTGSMDPITVDKGTMYKLPACQFTAPDNHLFAKWEQGEVGDEIQIVADIVIKPIWEERQADKAMITFDANGGTGNMQPKQVDINTKFKLPECEFVAPNAQLQEFDKWSLGAVGDSVLITQDTTIKALWKNIQVTIKFAPGLGTGTMDPITVDKGSKVELPACTFTAPENMVFDKWQIKPGEFANPKDSIEVTDNVTITAVWKHIVLTITFDANGGTGTQEAISVNKGDKFKLPKCTFTAPDGQKFDKWDAGETGRPDEEIVAVESLTIKALWVSTTGVEAERQLQLTIYPNPVSNMLNIKGVDLKTITLYDMLGRLVTVRPADSSTATVLHVNNYHPGVYLVRIELTNGQLMTRKVLINR